MKLLRWGTKKRVSAKYINKKSPAYDGGIFSRLESLPVKTHVSFLQVILIVLSCAFDNIKVSAG
jgi:hypothetical protein